MSQEKNLSVYAEFYRKAVDAAGGILVDSEGYSHAEYSALIPGKEKLELSGIPVESYLPGEHTGNRNQHQEEIRESKKDAERQAER